MSVTNKNIKYNRSLRNWKSQKMQKNKPHKI